MRIEAAVCAVRQLANHFGQSPDSLTETHLRDYFLFLKNKREYAAGSLAGPAQPPLDPERELKFYRWPSSRLTRADMIRLTELRSLLKRAITILLHEAVAAY